MPGGFPFAADSDISPDLSGNFASAAESRSAAAGVHQAMRGSAACCEALST